MREREKKRRSHIFFGGAAIMSNTYIFGGRKISRLSSGLSSSSSFVIGVEIFPLSDLRYTNLLIAINLLLLLFE